MKKNEFRKGYLAGAATVLVLILAVAAGYFLPDILPGVFKGGTGRISHSVSGKLDCIQSYIDRYYLNDTDDIDFESAILKSYVDALGDPYAQYYTKEEYEDILRETSGEYCGIGISVTQDNDGNVKIVSVYGQSPASEAGIKSGDTIVSVDGQETAGMSLDAVVAKIKGRENVPVALTLFRPAGGETINANIKRRIIDIPTISFRMEDDEKKIGYIQILEFDENTKDKFSKAIAELKNRGMRSVIFDVRDNPGGLYDTVCDMLDEILPAGTLVYTLDKNGNREDKTSDESCLDMPMVVLVNGGSASASEIFAGAVQDFDAGKIIGTKTFGKGIVQSTFRLPDSSSVKFTVSRYYTPDGKNIHGKGITPDITVNQREGEDTQLIRAVTELSGK